VLVAAAASALAITSAVLVARDAPSPAAVNSPASLADWAQTLADDPPRVGPGQYLYERIRSTTERNLDDPRFRVRITATGEQWIPHDHRDEWHLEYGGDHVQFVRGTESSARAAGATLPSPAPASTMEAKCGDFAHENRCDGEGWGITGSPAFYAGLTGDPARLYEVLEDRAGSSAGMDVFSQADRLLQPNVPSAFKATLFQAMSRIPGLRITDHARTTDGRTGIGLRMEADGTAREQILDPTTGDLLEGRYTTPDTTITGTVTYGVATAPGQRPN
jgi:hypothetical protein